MSHILYQVAFDDRIDVTFADGEGDYSVLEKTYATFPLPHQQYHTQSLGTLLWLLQEKVYDVTMIKDETEKVIGFTFDAGTIPVCSSTVTVIVDNGELILKRLANGEAQEGWDWIGCAKRDVLNTIIDKTVDNVMNRIMNRMIA